MALARALSKKIYTPTSGAHLSKKEADIYGRRLDLLARTGELTPERVLEDAKDPRSPLNKYFEWNDKKAAVKYRINQARYLLRAIAIEIVGPKGQVLETRAFHNVVVPAYEDGMEYSVRVYRPSVEVFDTDDLKSQIVKQALDALEGWQDRYGRYSELSGASFLVRRAIKTLRTHSKKIPKSPRRRGSKK